MKTNKDLKNEYKHIKPSVGIFQIKNEVNGKVLIDSGMNIISKWNRHKSELRFGSHRNKQLQNDWNTIGEDKFTFTKVSQLSLDDDHDLNINNELKLLKEMVLEEMDILDGMMY